MSIGPIEFFQSVPSIGQTLKELARCTYLPGVMGRCVAPYPLTSSRPNTLIPYTLIATWGPARPTVYIITRTIAKASLYYMYYIR